VAEGQLRERSGEHPIVSLDFEQPGVHWSIKHSTGSTGSGGAKSSALSQYLKYPILNIQINKALQF
jgi:hypothetical protein